MGRMQAMWSSKRLLADLYAANERIGHGALHLRKHSLPWSLRPVRRDEDPISAKSIKSSMRYVVEDCIRHVCGLVEEIACDLLKMLGFVVAHRVLVEGCAKLYVTPHLDHGMRPAAMWFSNVQHRGPVHQNPLVCSTNHYALVSLSRLLRK